MVGPVHDRSMRLRPTAVAVRLVGTAGGPTFGALETVRQILKKRTQAVEEKGMVHPQAERGVRRPDGRRAGPLSRRVRPGASGGVF